MILFILFLETKRILVKRWRCMIREYEISPTVKKAAQFAEDVYLLTCLV